MNDLISRQAAIDGLDGHRDERRHLNDWQVGWNEALDWVQDIYLEDLPSTQPEYRWIPVSERLPNFAQRVLVSTANFVYEAIYFDEDAGWSTYNVTFKDVEESEILAWMPLPATYREEN